MKPNASLIPFTHHRHEAPARWFLDGLWLILATGDDTNGDYAAIELVLPDGAGLPPHVHPFGEKTIYVLAGELTVRIAGEPKVLGPGSLAYVPRNAVHSFEVSGAGGCHLLNLYTPAGVEQALVACSRPADEQALPPKGLDAPDSQQVMQFFNNYWTAPADVPWARQKFAR